MPGPALSEVYRNFVRLREELGTRGSKALRTKKKASRNKLVAECRTAHQNPDPQVASFHTQGQGARASEATRLGGEAGWSGETGDRSRSRGARACPGLRGVKWKFRYFFLCQSATVPSHVRPRVFFFCARSDLTAVRT